MTRMYNPPHPGEILRDALEGLEMTVTDFAAYIGVARSTVNRVLSGQAGISPDMSIRLSEAFNQSQPDIWLLMQTDYDFWQASQAKRKKIKPLKAA
jgi:addiction module HigA family antidote